MHITIYWLDVLSHGSLHGLTSFQSPTDHHIFRTSRSLPSKIYRQPCNFVALSGHSKKSSAWQYFLNRILERRHDGLCNSLQLNLARKASLKHRKSLNLSPPFDLVCDMSQETHVIFFLFQNWNPTRTL